MRDVKNLPSKCRICNYADQKPRKSLIKQNHNVKVSFKSSAIPNLPKRLTKTQGIDQTSKYRPTPRAKLSQKSQMLQLPPHLCTNVKKLKRRKINNIESKKKKKGEYMGFMCPNGPALDHPMADLLLACAESGCTVECGPDWTKEHISQAINHGPHASAAEPEAAKYAWAEAKEKEEEGYCTIFNWDTLKHNYPSQLKLSPIAAIPHKSRAYRLILDLSFGLRVGGETKKSVNDTSSPAAPREALDYIGTTLPRIIHAVASAATDTPCLFAKADIKDGFWRIFVEKKGRWNFAYVLPKLNKSDSTHIVVPNSIQMGWVESMYVFCAGSETARDTSQKLLQSAKLPPHPLEHHMLPDKLEKPKELSPNNHIFSGKTPYLDGSLRRRFHSGMPSKYHRRASARNPESAAWNR